MAKPGEKLSDETRRKMSEAHLGQRLAPETREKISATLREQWRQIKILQAEAAE